MAETRQSKLRKSLSEGCIAEWYTLNGYFIRVYPAFNIDKVRFSFVEKGKKGAGFDVYVDTLPFQLLCDEVKSGMMRKKIDADAGQYPSAWKYTTGENGAKSIAIGKSKNGGVVIQGRDNSQKKQAFVPLQSYDDLREMALLFDVVSGKTASEGYWKTLKDIYDEGQKNQRWRTTEDDERTTTAPETEATPASAPAQEVQKAQQAQQAKTYDCRVLKAPMATSVQNVLMAEVEMNGKTLNLWMRNGQQMLDMIIAAAGKSSQIKVPIVIKGTGKSRQAWLAS